MGFNVFRVNEFCNHEVYAYIFSKSGKMRRVKWHFERSIMRLKIIGNRTPSFVLHLLGVYQMTSCEAGVIVTWWPCPLKKLATVSRIFRCLGSVGEHIRTLPVGSLFTVSLTLLLWKSKDAGTMAILSILAFRSLLGGLVKW